MLSQEYHAQVSTSVIFIESDKERRLPMAKAALHAAILKHTLHFELAFQVTLD